MLPKSTRIKTFSLKKIIYNSQNMLYLIKISTKNL